MPGLLQVVLLEACVYVGVFLHCYLHTTSFNKWKCFNAFLCYTYIKLLRTFESYSKYFKLSAPGFQKVLTGFWPRKKTGKLCWGQFSQEPMARHKCRVLSLSSVESLSHPLDKWTIISQCVYAKPGLWQTALDFKKYSSPKCLFHEVR